MRMGKNYNESILNANLKYSAQKKSLIENDFNLLLSAKQLKLVIMLFVLNVTQRKLTKLKYIKDKPSSWATPKHKDSQWIIYLL